MQNECQEIAVVIEGGIVQLVCGSSDLVESTKLDVTVIDYDTQGIEDNALSLVPQQDDNDPPREAVVYSMPTVPLDPVSIDMDGIVAKRSATADG